LYMPADLFDASGVRNFAEGPYIHEGAISTVNVASPRNDQRDDYWHEHGASIRLACELGSDGVACTYQLPGGQDHHRDASGYLGLLDRYLSGQPTPLPFSIEALIGSAVETILVE